MADISSESRQKFQPQGASVYFGSISENLPCWPLIRNAYEAARRRVLGERQVMADCAARRTWQERRLLRQISFDCAVQQSVVDPLLPVRWRPVSGGDVTGAAGGRVLGERYAIAIPIPFQFNFPAV